MSGLQFLKVTRKTLQFPDGSLTEEWRWIDPDGTPRLVSRGIEEYAAPPADKRLARVLFYQDWLEIAAEAYRDDRPATLSPEPESPSRLRELECERSPPRRVRRLSFRAAAKLAGRPVASVTDRPDGSRTYVFGQPGAAPEEEPPRASLFRAVPKPKVVL